MATRRGLLRGGTVVWGAALAGCNTPRDLPSTATDRTTGSPAGASSGAADPPTGTPEPVPSVLSGEQQFGNFTVEPGNVVRVPDDLSLTAQTVVIEGTIRGLRKMDGTGARVEIDAETIRVTSTATIETAAGTEHSRAATGETVNGLDGGPGGAVVLTAGKLQIEGTIFAGDGGAGQPAVATASGPAPLEAIAGDGAAGGDIVLEADERLSFGPDAVLDLGNGGSGGNALIAVAEKGEESNPRIRGGVGGNSGSVTISAPSLDAVDGLDLVRDVQQISSDEKKEVVSLDEDAAERFAGGRGGDGGSVGSILLSSGTPSGLAAEFDVQPPATGDEVASGFGLGFLSTAYTAVRGPLSRLVGTQFTSKSHCDQPNPDQDGMDDLRVVGRRGGNGAIRGGAGGEAVANGRGGSGTGRGGHARAQGGRGGDMEGLGLDVGPLSVKASLPGWGGTGGAADATGGPGGEEGGNGGNATAIGGAGGNGVLTGAVNVGGHGGDATAIGGDGRDSVPEACCDPPGPGHNGGNGGTADAQAGDGGRGRNLGGGGGNATADGGNGGDGSDGDPPGLGGQGGSASATSGTAGDDGYEVVDPAAALADLLTLPPGGRYGEDGSADDTDGDDGARGNQCG